MSSPTGAGSRTRRRFGVLVLPAVLVGLVVSGCAPATSPHAASGSYGKLPSWLPADTTRADGMLVADAAHPAVTSEGDQVEVRLARGSARMTVVGPEVPGEGLPVQQRDTTCTWTVTVDHATAPLRLAVADFDALDHLGTTYRVAAVPGQPAIPSTLAPGRTVTFELRAAMPTGEGIMRWSAGTGSALATWDFVVEND